MLGKDYHVTDTFLDAVFSVRTRGEETPQTFDEISAKMLAG
jgi:hypothetical protein